MEKVALLESYINNINNEQRNEVEDRNIIDLLKDLSELDPKCKYIIYLVNFCNLLKCFY